jgi:hypothetical protein
LIYPYPGRFAGYRHKLPAKQQQRDDRGSNFHFLAAVFDHERVAVTNI